MCADTSTLLLLKEHMQFSHLQIAVTKQHFVLQMQDALQKNLVPGWLMTQIARQVSGMLHLCNLICSGHFLKHKYSHSSVVRETCI